jgi:hypothetical protein
LILLTEVEHPRGSSGLMAVGRLDRQRKDHIALRLRYSATYTYLLSRWADRNGTAETVYRHVAYDVIVSVPSHNTILWSRHTIIAARGLIATSTEMLRVQWRMPSLCSASAFTSCLYKSPDQELQ